MSTTCGKGVIANQVQSCPDISAVGIKSITQSADLTKLYVTYTNNTTNTFTLPEAAPLPILYGTSAPANSLGAVGQTYIDTSAGNVYLKTGASIWTLELNIIGPQGPAGTSGTNGTSLLFSDATDSSTATLSAFTTIKSGTTDFTNANKNLVNVGDSFKVSGTIQSSNNTTTQSSTTLLFNAVELGAYANGAGQFSVGNAQSWKVESVITLTDATVNAQKVRIETTWTGYATTNQGGYTELESITIIQDLTGLNFNAANQTFSIQVFQIVANNLVAKEWRCETLKQS